MLRLAIGITAALAASAYVTPVACDVVMPPAGVAARDVAREPAPVTAAGDVARQPAPAVARDVVPQPPAGTFNGRLRQLDVRVPRLLADVRIDGALDDAVWAEAAVLTGFSQYAPVDRLPAADSTEVLVWYTDHAIYFGIRAFEPHGPVIANHADRDRIQGDDHVHIILDTFNDRRRALFFSVNPLGVQADGTFTEGGGNNVDLSPDFLWQSKGRVTDYGYEVEIRIPFKSIRYQAAPVQDWGVQVVRNVQHSGHEQTWTPAERGAPSFLGQAGRLVGLSDMRRGLVMDVNPVMTAHRAGTRSAGPGSPWQYGRTDPELGGNLRWGVTSNLTLNATVNPDFSQVEADVGQVVYDPRAALSFPERRPFFLEGNEHFAAPNNLIYTRRITSPVAAAKMTGKVGGLNVGLLSAVDDDAFSASRRDNPVYNIIRLRRDVGTQSSVGMVFTDRVEGSDYNRVAGFDSRLLIADRYVFSAQLAGSFTSLNGVESHGRPLFDVRLSRPGREWGFDASLVGTHPEFRAGSGFIARTGIVNGRISPRRTFFPASDAVQSVSTALIFDGTWEYDRFRDGTEPNDMKLQTSTNVTWRGGWRTTFFTFVESFMYPAYLYTNYYIERRDPVTGLARDTVPYTGTHRLPNYGGMFTVNTPQFQQFSGRLSLIGGHDDNFDEWSSAWVLFTTAEGEYRPTDRLRINGRYVQQRFHRVSDGSLVRLRTIPRARVEYQLSRAVFFRYVGQYDAMKVDALRDDSRTNDPILIRRPDGSFRPALAQQRSSFRSDVLFSYQPNPGTVLFAGYGSTLNGAEFFAPRDMERTADGFFVKVSYLWRL
jgi:hypothetical protein